MCQMKLKYKVVIVSGLVAVLSCKKSRDVTSQPPMPPVNVDTTGPLKTASIPIGIAVDYGLFKNNASYKNIVVR